MNDEPLFEVPEHWWKRRRCVVCGCALSVTFDHTYVVQRQWWVKIGATSNVRRRLNELSRPAWVQHLLAPPDMDWTEPLLTLGVIEGDVEHQLHAEFVECHDLGEWFVPDDRMREWLATLPSPAAWSTRRVPSDEAAAGA